MDAGRDGGAKDQGPGLEGGSGGDHGPGVDVGPSVDVVPWLEAGPDGLVLPDSVVSVPGASCKAAVAVTPSTGGTTTLKGTTRGAPNEFGKKIKCGTGTDFDGNQVYYKLTLSAGTAYRMVLNPSGWDGALYLFLDGTCTPATIDAQCALNVADDGGSGEKETLVYAPPVSGTYLLAVDSYSATASGSFSLTIDGFTPAAASDCKKPTKVTLGSSKVTLNGDTSKGAVNQFGTAINCGGVTGMPGPQLYYSVTLAAGKAYSLTLKPSFDARLYVFSQSACGVTSSINAACGSQGNTGVYSGEVKLGTTKTLVFKPQTAGTYLVAVDSTSQGKAGAFSLELEPASVPVQDRCTGATPVTMSSGKGSVSGDTTLAGSDVALTSSACAGVATPGPDLFYKVAVSSGKSYRFSLEPAAGYDPALYVFTSCSNVPGTCLAGAERGIAGVTEDIKLTASANATYVVGVDSRHALSSSLARGSFTLDVSEYVKPTNDRCASATSLAWSSGKATVTADTFYASNEFAGVTCGGKLKFPGPQLYYKVALTGGKKYLVTLTPATDYDAALYAFPASTSCSESAINAGCKGWVSDAGSKGKAERLTLAPSASGSWIVAADSWSINAHGTFTLSVEELIKPKNDTCAAPTALTFPTGITRITSSGHTFAASNSINLSSSGCTKNTTAGPDVFFSVKMEKGKTYSVSLDGSGYNASLYVFTSCSSASSTCAAGADTSTTKVEQVDVTPAATATYIIGVDGRGASDAGSYTLTLEEAISPCSKVQPMSFNSSGVATATGNTASGTNIIDLATASCLKKATPGSDAVFSINLVSGKSYTVTLTPATSYDALLAASTSCAHPHKSCLSAADAGGAGAVESLTLKPTASGTHYIVVDSTSSTKAGAFTLQVK
jgi:hypothetical protein